MHIYEKCCLTYEEAKEIQRKTGGTISSFLSTGENGEAITVFCVRYQQLF